LDFEATPVVVDKAELSEFVHKVTDPHCGRYGRSDTNSKMDNCCKIAFALTDRVGQFRDRFANHRLDTGTPNIVEGWDSGEVTNLPLVGQPIGQLAHFRLGQVHQQLREV
jgi:hypothetical protein